jgi:hypothetical protein
MIYDSSMSGVHRHGDLCRLVFAAVLLLSAAPLLADPITDIHEENLLQPKTIFSVAAAILVEAGCVLGLLRRWRTPRLFVVWIMGMHLVTYPLFLALVWLGIHLQPALAVAAGEGAIVVVEGSLIYLICRYAPSAQTRQPAPSIFKSLIASLAGNACSAAAFPLLVMAVGW